MGGSCPPLLPDGDWERPSARCSLGAVTEKASSDMTHDRRLGRSCTRCMTRPRSSWSPAGGTKIRLAERLPPAGPLDLDSGEKVGAGGGAGRRPELPPAPNAPAPAVAAAAAWPPRGPLRCVGTGGLGRGAASSRGSGCGARAPGRLGGLCRRRAQEAQAEEGKERRTTDKSKSQNEKNTKKKEKKKRGKPCGHSPSSGSRASSLPLGTGPKQSVRGGDGSLALQQSRRSGAHWRAPIKFVGGCETSGLVVHSDQIGRVGGTFVNFGEDAKLVWEYSTRSLGETGHELYAADSFGSAPACRRKQSACQCVQASLYTCTHMYRRV